ncbi:MAG: non-canonical purine NTP pyrophosphatase [Treponemataceae bacterium]
MEILFASGNEHKKIELANLLQEHSVIIPKDKGIDFNPVEDGKSFCENSLIKARDLFDRAGIPVLADDSGLCIDALDGKPGIFSARYGGSVSQKEKNHLIVQELNDFLGSQGISTHEIRHRKCHFVCAMTFYFGTDQFICVQEICEGFIVPTIEESRGKDGFGYDPIVYLSEFKKTIAELSAAEKNTISHRAKACQKIKPFL